MFAAVLFPQVLNGSLVLLLRVRGTVRRCVLSSSGSEHVLFSHPRTMCSHISTTAFFFLNELNELDELWRAVTISSFLHSGCRSRWWMWSDQKVATAVSNYNIQNNIKTVWEHFVHMFTSLLLFRSKIVSVCIFPNQNNKIDNNSANQKSYLYPTSSPGLQNQ